MKRLVPLLVILLALSACKVRIEVGTTIEADGSGTVSFAVGFDEEFRQAIETFSQLDDESSGDFFEDIEGDAPAGWSTERFSDGDIEGVRISRDFSDLDDLREAFRETQGFGEGGDELGADGPTPGLGDEISIERDGDILTLDLAAPETTPTTTGGDDFFGDQNPFEDLEFEVVVRFTLPGEIQDHNADESDGNTLTWRFDQESEPTPIRATSDISKSAGGGSDFPIALVIAIAVLVAGGVGLFLWNRNRQQPAPAGGPSPDDTGGAPPPPPPSEPPAPPPPPG